MGGVKLTTTPTHPEKPTLKKSSVIKVTGDKSLYKVRDHCHDPG